MKRLLTTIAAALLFIGGANQAIAQTEDGAFSDLSVGLGIGTTGIEFQVASSINSFLALRAGYSFMPSIKPSFNVDFDSTEDFLKKEDGSGYYDNTDIEAKLSMGDLKLLVDAYPSKKSSFHFTAGFYLGKSTMLKANNTSTFINKSYWGNSGPELGTTSSTYTVVSDPNGNINAEMRINSFKPYIGVGFGRAVPKNRLNVSFDFGVQFWGKPSLWTTISDDYGKEFRKVERDRITNTQDYCDDIRDGLEIMEKVIVYPVMTVRLNGRIF